MPETKLYTLEELDHVCWSHQTPSLIMPLTIDPVGVSATRFARYQLAETIPYLAQYCVHPKGGRTRRKPLYEIAAYHGPSDTSGEEVQNSGRSVGSEQSA